MKSGTKRLAAVALSVLLTSSLSACAPTGITVNKAIVSPIEDDGVVLPSLAAQPSGYHAGDAMLYYRFSDEPFLAAEARQVTSAPDRPYELTVASALLEGPVSRSGELTGLFPTGTRVISTALQGRLLFVTLSREVMNAYPDEPAAWQSDPYWQREVPLRRRLAMQSLVATLTENCDVDSVQVLVEQTADTMADSLRLKQSYFMTNLDGLTDPMTRCEEMLLTPVNAMQVIMQLWQMQDWQRLYRYTSQSSRSDQADFFTLMENLPRIGSFRVSGGSVSADGSTCLVTVVLSVAGGGEEKQFAFRLERENNLWKLPQEQMIMRQEAM